MIPQLVIVGAGGHAGVLAEIVNLSGRYRLAGFTDPKPNIKGKQILGSPVLGTDEVLPELLAQGIENAIVGVGSVGDNGLRKSLFEKIIIIGFHLVTLIHPTAVISSTAILGRGSVVMANATINTNAKIGDNAIINSGAIIEHDCILGDHVHIASGACLASGVQIGPESHIGVGTSVIQGISVGPGSLIGAGAVVVRDIPDHVVAFGVPAQVVRKGTE